MRLLGGHGNRDDGDGEIPRRRSRHSDSPFQRMDHRHGAALSARQLSEDLIGVHHPRHEHRPEHLRQRQAPLRIFQLLRRRPDGPRAQHGVEALAREGGRPRSRLLHDSERSDGPRMRAAPAPQTGCGHSQRVRARLCAQDGEIQPSAPRRTRASAENSAVADRNTATKASTFTSTQWRVSATR